MNGQIQHIIGISKRYNHYSSRRKLDSSCGSHWRVYYYDDNGRFRSDRVSWIEAKKLKIIKALANDSKKKSNKVRSVICDKCGFKQEEIGQDFCLNCGE